jgi:hypothetical protein
LVLEILRHFPLASAAAWFLIVGFQIYRDRYHTRTEAFFLLACAFAGLYAIADWFFFNLNDSPLVMIAAMFSLASVTLTALFLLLFTLVYVGRLRQPVFWGFVAFAGLVLALIPLGMVTSVTRQSPEFLWVATFNQPLFALLLIFIILAGFGGVSNLYRLYRIVKQHSDRLARRTRGLVITFTLVMVLGLMTNGYLGVIGNQEIPPPFSTLLLVTAFSLSYVLYPGAGERISLVIRRFQASRYTIKAAFLIFGDGTVISSRVRPGENIVDTDLFSATLDVIQNFMRTSFPGLRGKWLRSIAHGDHTIVMERGRYAYITVLLEGEETDQLRRHMRDLLLEFEARNRDVLARWRGVPEEAVGVDDALMPLFETGREPLQLAE